MSLKFLRRRAAFFPLHDPLLLFWSGVGRGLSPLVRHGLTYRARKGKECPLRLSERLGLPSSSSPARPPHAPLLWIHAASVGETRSVFPLIEKLLADSPSLMIMVTTTTVTGGHILSQHPAFGGRLFHQFIPCDIPYWTQRFLRHWRPCGAVFVESEVWPGTIRLCHHNHIPFMLINARLSDRSVQRWGKARFFLRYLLNTAQWIAARTHQDAQRLRSLGIHHIVDSGDLKEDAALLPAFPEEEQRLRYIIGDRPLIVAASTHEGEEDLIIQATHHARLICPHLLTIIIPRHPNRGASLAQRYHIPRRSMGDDPHSHHPLWLADTLGEMGLFYRLPAKVIMGNSLCPPGGGHNPLEPLRLGRPVATGPWISNWQPIYHRLTHHIATVHDVSSLTQWMTSPLTPAPSFSEKEHTTTERIATRILDTIIVHH